MNKNKKIFLVLIITILIVSAFCKVIAVSTINPNDYDPSKTPITTDDTDEVFSKTGIILGAVRNISAVVAVITLMIIGLKYMFGSVEQKANYKATMMPYIIGCVLAVAGTTIVTFIYESVYGL